MNSPSDDDQAEFERGLESILGPMREQGASQEQLDEVTNRAKEFFISRRHASSAGLSNGQESRQLPTLEDHSTQLIDLPEHLSSASMAPSLSTSGTAAPEPPFPTTFEQIAEMIANGTPIPGIRDIPDKLNEETPSEARVAKQEGAGLKPWEKASTMNGIP